MSDRGWIEPIVERVVSQVLDSHAAQLRSEIVRGVMEELAAQPVDSVAPAGSTADLARAVCEIQGGSSQKEILRTLLDSGSRYAARVALFVVKGSHATGWEARGFASNDGVKDFALDSNAPAVLRVLADRVAASVPAGEFDARFFEEFGSPAGGEARLLPLILKDKVAALVYADGAAGTLLDAGSLEVLVLAAGAWLEVNALRKQAHKEASAAHSDGHGVPVPAAASGRAFNDPFAAHAPVYALAAAASADSQATAAAAAPEPPVDNLDASLDQRIAAEAQSAAAEVQSAAAATVVAAAEPLPIGHAQTEAAPEAALPASAIPAEDQEVHLKAQRFARLLVDEIKLYNQAKVSEGRRNNDLYDRLKDVIEKSRATYQKRYGNTVAASGNYFHHEVIRSLAEDDLKIMGPNFPK